MNQWDQAVADHIVNDLMWGQDAFSQWMGIKVLEINPDCVRLIMTITDSMTNGFQIGHGGIVYSLCDSALAFLSNAGNRKAVSIETQISHIRPIRIGDQIEAKAYVLNVAKKLGRYSVVASNNTGEVVATFSGTVYFTGDLWVEHA